MFGHIGDIVKKKEALLQRKEPLFYDVEGFFKENNKHLLGKIVPYRFERGILTVRAVSPGFLQEFFLIKKDLILFLQKEKKQLIREIITHVR